MSRWGPGWEGGSPTARNFRLAGTRRGYHVTSVILPHWNVSVQSREALAIYTRMNPEKPIVWHHEGTWSWWETTEMADLKARLLKMVVKRTRGLRSTYRQLGSLLDATQGTVARVIRALRNLGLVTVTTTRGRRGRTVIRMLQPQNKEGGTTTTSTLSSSSIKGGAFPRQAPEVPPEDPPKLGEGEWWDRLREQARLRYEEINREVPW